MSISQSTLIFLFPLFSFLFAKNKIQEQRARASNEVHKHGVWTVVTMPYVKGRRNSTAKHNWTKKSRSEDDANYDRQDREVDKRREDEPKLSEREELGLLELNEEMI